MNKFTYVLVFAILFLVVGVLISIPFNQWYTVTYVKGEEDVGPHMWISVLVLWPVLLFLGGWFGNRLFKRNLTFSSRERADKRRTP